MTAPPRPSRRLLIGAGSFADAQTAFQLAERFAEEMAEELGGMLVEETFLTEIAGLPKQRIITSSGALIGAPSPTQFRTLMAGDAKAFRKALSAIARSRKWSFEQRRGELICGLCEAASGWDLLLLGHRQMHRLTGQVLLIRPPLAASQEAVHLATKLAVALRTRSVALALGAAEPLQEPGIPNTEAFESEGELLKRMGRIHASAVVLDLGVGPLRTYDQLRMVLAAARCPVLVLGASQGEPSAPDAARTEHAQEP